LDGYRSQPKSRRQIGAPGTAVCFGLGTARSEDDVSQSRGRRAHRTLLAAVAIGGLTCASAALAATPVKGGGYSGQLAAPRSAYLVSFKVAASGKQVTGLKISNTPFYCPGGGPPIPVHFANATISKAGTFTSTGKYVIVEGPLKGQVGTKLKITGKFTEGAAEQGTVTSTFPKTPKCSGKSSYTTKAELG
jgi:hypothetical protein